MKFKVGDRVRFRWDGAGIWKGDYFAGEGLVTSVREDPAYPYRVQPDWDTVEAVDSTGLMGAEQTVLFGESELDYADDGMIDDDDDSDG